MNKFEMLDEIILQLDRMADAKGVSRCAILVDVVNRLGALKTGLRDEDEQKKTQIEALEAQIRDMTQPPPLKDGEVRMGGQTYTVDLSPKEE